MTPLSTTSPWPDPSPSFGSRALAYSGGFFEINPAGVELCAKMSNIHARDYGRITERTINPARGSTHKTDFLLTNCSRKLVPHPARSVPRQALLGVPGPSDDAVLTRQQPLRT